MEDRNNKIVEENIDVNDEKIGLTDVRLVSFSDNIVGYKNRDKVIDKLKQNNELR